MPPLAGNGVRSAKQVASSISSVFCAMEVCGGRLGFTNPQPFHKLADCAFNIGVVTGKMHPASMFNLEQLSEVECSLKKNGASVANGKGSSGAVVGPQGAHPLESLTWLVNHLNSRGLTLQSGQIVITGAAALYKGPFSDGDDFEVVVGGGVGTVAAKLVAPAKSRL